MRADQSYTAQQKAAATSNGFAIHWCRDLQTFSKSKLTFGASQNAERRHKEKQELLVVLAGGPSAVSCPSPASAVCCIVVWRQYARELLQRVGAVDQRVANNPPIFSSHSNALKKMQLQSWLPHRRCLLPQVAERWETSLKILGVTAIEDRLQESVGDTIDSLLKAGIRVWMLTGRPLSPQRLPCLIITFPPLLTRDDYMAKTAIGSLVCAVKNVDILPSSVYKIDVFVGNCSKARAAGGSGEGGDNSWNPGNGSKRQARGGKSEGNDVLRCANEESFLVFIVRSVFVLLEGLASFSCALFPSHFFNSSLRKVFIATPFANGSSSHRASEL